MHTCTAASLFDLLAGQPLVYSSRSRTGDGQWKCRRTLGQQRRTHRYSRLKTSFSSHPVWRTAPHLPPARAASGRRSLIRLSHSPSSAHAHATYRTAVAARHQQQHHAATSTRLFAVSNSVSCRIVSVSFRIASVVLVRASSSASQKAVIRKKEKKSHHTAREKAA